MSLSGGPTGAGPRSQIGENLSIDVWPVGWSSWSLKRRRRYRAQGWAGVDRFETKAGTHVPGRQSPATGLREGLVAISAVARAGPCCAKPDGALGDGVRSLLPSPPPRRGTRSTAAMMPAAGLALRVGLASRCALLRWGGAAGLRGEDPVEQLVKLPRVHRHASCAKPIAISVPATTARELPDGARLPARHALGRPPRGARSEARHAPARLPRGNSPAAVPPPIEPSTDPTGQLDLLV